MQPISMLTQTLELCGGKDHFLFSESDFLSLFPHFTVQNLRMLLSRAAARGILERVCKGLYLYTKAGYDPSLVLFAVAARMRAAHFSYVSLETVLSHAGLISQLPMGWITVMTRGRRGIIQCGRFGAVEYLHTQRMPQKILAQLHLDPQTGMWWASPTLALQDMRQARRPMDLVEQAGLVGKGGKGGHSI